MRWRNWLMVMLFVLTAVITVPATAAAQPLGGLVITPGESVDAVPVRLRTDAGCPVAATGYLATMRGHGLADAVVVSTSDVGMSHTEGFEVHLAYTFKDFAADNKTELRGRYDITLRCVDMFTQQSFGEFGGSLDFAEPGRYAAIGKAKGPARQTAPAIPPDFAGPPAETAQPAQAPPGPPAAGVAPEVARGQAQQAPDDGTRPFLYIALGIVALVLVAAASHLWRKAHA
ncbi:hypothetical protein SAMN05192558_104415 [Actinokineospora alba]|uniref:Uncharacterized protein n=1 Tax=Actinokineospora alba TaxID=504798 RepID=A0A1H0M5N2_9PSEU|nr:hypothetical protein [Actinokineospora alba]TDP67586.1 hypothetical protein C8E96_3132 [Actinokineospora alba]SDI44985.1 hypothetical protein SAMN05421871_10545 [Actinokineospora alba]SDO75430.1 hypothetical protein SAMN05192558_104415 [Actinokineospora alba]